MGSGVFISIKLDPFYQQFLRGQFNNNDLVFKFPKGHDLLLRLEHFLSVPPNNYVGENNIDSVFNIEVPYMEHKDVFCYTYLSKTTQSFFISRIRDFQKLIFHEEFGRLRRMHFHRAEIVYILLEQYGIERKYFDRVLKDYNRFLSRNRSHTHRKKNRNNSPQLGKVNI